MNSHPYIICPLFAVFEPFKDNKVELLMPKLVFLALNLGGLALGIWKVIKFYGFASFPFKKV